MAEILLIEPDRMLGKIYASCLKKAKHSVRLVSNAQAAITAIDKHIPSLIILELQLAEHSGVEFLYELRSYTEWQKIPIIVQTLVPPNLFFNNKQQMKNLGIAQFLYKPSTQLAKLEREVRAVLRLVPA